MPQLNIDPTDLFVKVADPEGDPTAPIDADFVAPGAPLPRDYMDTGGVFAPKFKGIQEQQREDQASQYDRDNAIGQSHSHDPNPAQQTAPYGQLLQATKQSEGFLTQQARQSVTAGVVATLEEDSLVGGRVLFKSAAREVEGTVVAVGDAEFCVVWDDKEASVEKKSDYELMIRG